MALPIVHDVRKLRGYSKAIALYQWGHALLYTLNMKGTIITVCFESKTIIEYLCND